MRILMISDVYYPRINGVSTSIKTFNKELEKLDHEVVLIAPAYGECDKTYDCQYRIPSRYVPVDPEDRMMKRKYISALNGGLATMNFDILHIQTPFVAHYAGVELSRKLNIPRVVTYHTHFEEYLYHYLPYLPKRAMRFSARWFNRRQCNDVDGVIVPSRAMQDVLVGYGINRPIEIIATGIDGDFFNPGNGEAFRTLHGIEPDRPVLVHIGRVAHEKNIDFLMHMLVVLKQSIPDVLLIIAGEGPAESHLRKLTSTLKLQNNVLFVGYLDRTASLLDCYRAGNVFVFASRTETQGLVLLEAMAQGVPVVSISALGTNDILDNRMGAIVSNEDTREFADKVRLLLCDSNMQAKLAEEAEKFARSWSAGEFAVKAEKFYENTVDGYRLN